MNARFLILNSPGSCSLQVSGTFLKKDRQTIDGCCLYSSTPKTTKMRPHLVLQPYDSFVRSTLSTCLFAFMCSFIFFYEYGVVGLPPAPRTRRTAERFVALHEDRACSVRE